MFGILIVAAFGYLTQRMGKPFHFAGLAAFILFLLGLLMGGALVSSAVAALLYAVYCSALYWAVDRFRDDMLVVIPLIAVGSAVPFLFF